MAIEGLTARLYLDHNLHARLAPGLRQRGFDVISALDFSRDYTTLIHLDDEVHIPV